MIAVVSRDEECPTQSVEISGRCCVDGRECASGLSLCLLTQAVSQLSTLSLSPGPGPTSGSDSGDRGPGPVTNLAPVNDVWELAKSFQPKKSRLF